MNKNALLLNQQGINRAAEWAKLRIWVSAILAIVCISAVGWLWYTYQTTLPRELLIGISGLGLILAVMLLLYISNNSTQIKLLQQASAEHDIRIDIVNAVEDSLCELLAKHISGYDGLCTKLAIGEELMKEIGAVSERYARFQSQLAAKFPEMQLAEAIDALVAEAARSQGVEVSVATLADFLEKRA